MNVEQMRYFGKVYETCSYTLAARKASITPTGLMKAIASLERLFHVELFQKNDAGNLIPTEFADELYRFYNRFETDYALLGESFERIRAQKNKTIRFGSCMGMWGLMGPNFLIELEKQHPDITLVYSEYNDVECDNGLRRQHFERAFTVAPYSNDFITTELHQDQICFWVPRSSPLSEHSSLRAQDFQAQSIAIPRAGYKVYDSLTKLCEPVGVELGFIYDMSELYRIYDFVEKGLGIGFTVQTVAEFDFFKKNPDVICIPTEDLTLRFGLSHLPYHALTEPEQRFYDFCVGYL